MGEKKNKDLTTGTHMEFVQGRRVPKGLCGGVHITSPFCDVGSVSTALSLHWTKKVICPLLFKNSLSNFCLTNSFMTFFRLASVLLKQSHVEMSHFGGVKNSRYHKQLKTSTHFD